MDVFIYDLDDNDILDRLTSTAISVSGRSMPPCRVDFLERPEGERRLFVEFRSLVFPDPFMLSHIEYRMDDRLLHVGRFEPTLIHGGTVWKDRLKCKDDRPPHDYQI